MLIVQFIVILLFSHIIALRVVVLMLIKYIANISGNLVECQGKDEKESYDRRSRGILRGGNFLYYADY